MTENLRPRDVIIKRATRQQIEASGGVESAPGATRVNRGSLGHYQNPLMTAAFMPVDVVIDLTLDSGQPYIIQALAQLAGGVFIRTENHHDHQHPTFPELVASFGRDAGLVLSESATLISKRNKEEKPVYEDIIASLHEVISVAAATIAAIQDEKEKHHG